MAQLEIRTLHHTINNLTRYNENLTKEIEVSHLISFVWKLFIYHLTNLFICIFNANIAYLKNIKNFHAHVINRPYLMSYFFVIRFERVTLPHFKTNLPNKHNRMLTQDRIVTTIHVIPTCTWPYLQLAFLFLLS